MFELLDALQDKVWSLYGPPIQTLLHDEQGSGDLAAHLELSSRNDPTF